MEFKKIEQQCNRLFIHKNSQISTKKIPPPPKKKKKSAKISIKTHILSPLAGIWDI